MHNLGYITALRFPLALLVVLIHAYNAPWRAIEGDTFEAIAAAFSYSLPAFAVPLFFLMSGFLFFRRTPTFTTQLYLSKLRRRSWTLLLPYLVWNLIAFALYAAKDVAAGQALQQSFSADLFWGCKVRGTEGVNLLGLPVEAATAPIQLQLWFVRDLIVLSLLSPVFHFLFKRLGNWGLLLLGLIYYSGLWTNPLGFSFEGVWFFGLGAWCSLCHVPLVTWSRRLSGISLPLTGFSLLAMVMHPFLPPTALPPSADISLTFVQELYCYAAMMSAIYLADRFTRRYHPSGFLAQSSFFLYASHTIVLLPLTTWVAAYCAPHGVIAQTAGFLLCPLVAVLLCEVAYAAVRQSRWLSKALGA